MLNLTQKKSIICSVLALLSFVISLFILRNGVGGGPDEWAYWQGSVNLIENHRYSYMSGNHIYGWPPLFPLYLAFIQLFFGQNGQALGVAMSVIGGLATYAWCAYAFNIFPKVKDSRDLLALAGTLVFVVFFVPLCSMCLFSNSLVLFFTGVLFSRLSLSNDVGRFRHWYGEPVALGIILCASLLTHNSSIVYVMVTIVAVLFASGSSMRQRLIACCVIFLVSFVPSTVVIHWLGENKSHHFGHGTYGPLQYIGQILNGIGDFFISSASVLVQGFMGVFIFLCFFIAMLRRSRAEEDERYRLCLIMSLLILGGLFIIFNAVPIGDHISGRFTFYFPLAVTPIFFATVGKRRLLLFMLLFFTIGTSGARTCKRVWNAEFPPLNAQVTQQPSQFIFSEYFLTSRTNPVVPLGRILVTVPVYPWERLGDENRQVEKEPVVTLVNSK